MLAKYFDPELLRLPDCSGLTENDGCTLISREDTRVRTCARLYTLPETVQAHISVKYYGGLQPWKEAENV